ncbi:MAG TPA: acyl-CoA dehydrogenase family protein [Burkholderiaceae bacterium]
MSPIPPPVTNIVPAATRAWLAAHAAALDCGPEHAAAILPTLAQAGLLRLGVPPALGGKGGSVRDKVGSIAEVARESLTAAFVLWGQSAFIDYLLASANPAPRARWLPALLDGSLAGAVGLSNVMKFLSHIEPLQVRARPEGTGWRVDGLLPWVTNLRPEGFAVVLAVRAEGRAAPVVLAIDSRWPGVARSADLDLLALRGSNTAAIVLDGVLVPGDAVLADPGPPCLRAARPRFLGLQCGMAIGLAQAALDAARGPAAGGARAVLGPRIDAAAHTLQAAQDELFEGLDDGRYEALPAPLFRLRQRFAALVQEALQLELQATGGRAYLRDQAPAFGRRWRESAFIPVVTPSLVQLQSELDQHGAQQ